MRHALALIVLFAANAAFSQETEMLSWRPAAAMEFARTRHCAVALTDGSVLIAGGIGMEESLAAAEVYGPEDRFTRTGNMHHPRSGHACTLLDDGRVVATGGIHNGSAETWDADSGQWTLSEGDAFPYREHTATRLLDGRVLLAGGSGDAGPSAALFLFDPVSNRIRVLPVTLSFARSGHIAHLLPGGRVLLAGGIGVPGVLHSAEIFDPIAESVHPAAPMEQARAHAGSVALPDGGVLAIAGMGGAGELSSAEIYSEDLDQWEPVPSMLLTPRRHPFVSLLPSGEVLVAGGEWSGRPLEATEVYNGFNREFRSAGDLTAARSSITGAIIPGTNRILATGGAAADGPSRLCGVLSTASLTVGVSALTPALTDFNPGVAVVARGTGFGDSTPVQFSLIGNGSSIDGRLVNRTATPASGEFSTTVFNPVASDLGGTFQLSAFRRTLILASANFSVRSSVAIQGGPTTGSFPAGVPVEFDYSLNPQAGAGPMSGSVTIQAGPALRSFPLVAYSPGSRLRHSVCCIDEPGTYPFTVTYGGDRRHQLARLSSVRDLTITASTLVFAASVASLALFEESEVPMTVSLPAGAPPGRPAPTGTLTVSADAFGPVNLPLSPSARGNSSSALFRFRPVAGSRPSTCFTARYSGNAVYPPQTGSVCIAVGPARPVLEATPPSREYVFGERFSLPVRVTIPREVRLLNPTVEVSFVSRTLILSSARLPLIQDAPSDFRGGLLLPVPFGTRSISVTFLGGGDLGSTTATVPVQMRPIATRIGLTALPSPATNPVPLEARLTGCPDFVDCSALPRITGRVRFFDGATQIGEVGVTSAGPASGSAVLRVARPSGTGQLRAEYLGDDAYAPSASAALALVFP